MNEKKKNRQLQAAVAIRSEQAACIKLKLKPTGGPMGQSDKQNKKKKIKLKINNYKYKN